MKIFITGGSGFIGKNLKEQLAAQYVVYAPSSTELNLLDANAVQSYLKDHCFDMILHTATWNATRNSKKDTSCVLENNVRMFFNLARSIRFYGRMINLGSGAEYDREHWIPEMREDYFDSYVPSDQYGFSKYIINKYIENAENSINLRLFGVFGKYEDWEIRFISNACCMVVHDLPVTINQNVCFDYLYIDDLVKIIEWFIKNNPLKKSYNICTGSVNELKSLAEKIIRISGKNLDIVIKKEGYGKEYSGDNSLFLREAGNFHFTNMDESIRKLYHWYDDNKEMIDKDKLNK